MIDSPARVSMRSASSACTEGEEPHVADSSRDPRECRVPTAVPFDTCLGRENPNLANVK